MPHMQWSHSDLGEHAWWVVAGYMAHPANEQLRDMHHAYMMAKHLTVMEYAEPFTADFWEVMAAAAERGMGADLGDASSGGMMAGDVLLTVIEMHHNGMVDSGVEKACHGVSELYSRRFPKAGGGHFDASLASVRNHWRTYRTVSHYWAAYLILWRELETSMRAGGNHKLEGMVKAGMQLVKEDGLFLDKRFLPLAEALYRMASGLRLPRSRAYLLDDAAWRLWGIEPANVEAAGITDKYKAVLDAYSPRER